MFAKKLSAKLFVVCLLLVCFCSIGNCQNYQYWEGYGYVFPYYGTKATNFHFAFAPSNNHYLINQNESLNHELLNLTLAVGYSYVYVNEQQYGIQYGMDGFWGTYECWIKGDNLEIGNNLYYFTCEHPEWRYWKSKIFDGPMLSEEKIQFDFASPIGNPFWGLYISTINKSQRGVVYFVFINQTIPDEIYSAPNWEKGIKPLGTCTFPPNYFVILDVNKLYRNLPTNKFPGTWTYAIAAFAPESYELISNVATHNILIK